MKTLYTISTLCMLNSCVSIKDKFNRGDIVPPDLQSSVDRLRLEAKNRGAKVQTKRIMIKYEKTGLKGVAAACFPMGPIIKIEPEYKNRPQSHKDLIILHEAGHCWFKLEHLNANDRIMGPGGFMEDLKEDPWQPKYLDPYFDYVLKTQKQNSISPDNT